MKEPANGFEFLEQLRQANGKPIQDYTRLSHYLDNKAREKGVPVHAQIELTPLCNFDCKMCYVHLNANQLNGRSVLSVDEWKELIHQAWEAGMLHTTLTGGECLAYPGFEDIYLYLHSLGCDVSVLTNGYLLNEKWIQFFADHKPLHIQVTLYGWNDDVYERVTGERAFSRVADNIRKAIDAGLSITVTVTPSTFLGEDVLETVRVAKKLCEDVTVSSALFTPREETGRSKQDDNAETDIYIRIYQLLNELDGRKTKEIDVDKLPPTGGEIPECVGCGLHCGGGRSSFVLNWKGIMMPCNRMSMIHADALSEGVPASWKKVNEAANNWPRVPECERCPYVKVCNNCAGNMLRFANPGELPVKLCEQTKQFVSHGVRTIPECEE